MKHIPKICSNRNEGIPAVHSVVLCQVADVGGRALDGLRGCREIKDQIFPGIRDQIRVEIKDHPDPLQLLLTCHFIWMGAWPVSREDDDVCQMSESRLPDSVEHSSVSSDVARVL